MIQLKIVSGKKAGAVVAARRFPFRIGRAAKVDLQLEENGVWDDHLQIDFDASRGFVMNTRAESIATVNGQPMQTSILRNGDIIEIGSTKICFWLGEIVQRSSRWREWFVWTMIAAISLGQIALVYRMMD